MATLTQEWICFILFRFAMPIVFLAATIFRFNIFSLAYGFLMLINAFLSRPTFFSMTRGLTGKYLMVSMVLTSAALLSQSIFQIYAAVTLRQHAQSYEGAIMLETPEEPSDGNFSNINADENYNLTLEENFSYNKTMFNAAGNCTLLDSILDQVGLQRIQHNNARNVIRILCPDMASFLVTLACLWCCQAWLSKPSIFRPSYARAIDEQICKCANIISLYLGNSTLVGLIATAGILCPSLINLFYFLVFILSMTMWSLVINNSLQLLWFQRIRYFMAGYAALHLLVIYLRQFPKVNEFWGIYVTEGSLWDRLLGVTRFTSVSNGCGEPQFIDLRTDLPPLRYVHVVVLVLLYFVLASEIRRWMLKMKFLTIRNVVNVNSIHQKILLKGDAEEPYASGNDGTLGSTSKASNRGSIGSVGFDPMVPFPNVDPNRNQTPGSFSSFYAFKEYALKQSYIGTLIVMMVWSITYHSWLTFVLLLGACIIWVMPLKRALCLKFSPVILFYAIGLLMLQYIYGLDLTNHELPSALENGFELRDIGLVKYENPAGPLAIKLMFTCVFWLTLRHSQERKCGLRHQDNDITMEAFGMHKRSQQLTHSQSHESDLIWNVGRWIWHTMCKYWIFACAGLFLFISLQEAVVFRLIYMTMFLYFVITFQVSYKFWRMSIQVFWWVVILYSMGVLTCIYTFQFKGFPDHWKYFTGMSDQMLLNLGLKTIDTTELFIDLLTPTSFLIVVSIQLHYFQKDFLKMSDLNRFKSMGVVSPTEETIEPSALAGRRARIQTRRLGVVRLSKKDRLLVFCTYLWNKAYAFLNLTSAILWRFVEVHIFKVTTSTIFICCVTEISALNTLLVVVVVILLPFPRLHSAMLILEMILASAILLFKMIYQMDIIVDDLMSSNCSPIENPMNGTLNNTDFIGIHKVKNMALYLMIYILMILMLGLESVVRYHQAQHYRHPNHERPKDGIVFIDIKRVHADQGLKQCFKFFINYSFYKFGKELCFIMTMTTMVVRLDMYSVVYGLFLGLLLLLNRRQCAFVWPFYVAILVVLLVAQYLSCVGAPPALCWVYPWSNNIYRNLKIFLYLPDYNNPPFPHKLICDFFQLLFACLQWNVFYVEANKLSEYGGDDNRSIYNRLKSKIKNPQSDFLSYKDSYLDYIKMVVFYHSFWVTLMVVFISGMSRISLFCMGYLIGCFVFLWFGEGMLLKPLNKLIAMWMGLLMYCYLVLLAKCILQLIGCVYLSSLVEKHCWVIQLFNIVCLRSANYVFDGLTDETVCKMSVGEAGLSWDAFCFVFLLLMLRIFKTWYFQHVVNELRINSKLAARGAELINNKLIDDINMVKANEERVLQNIKIKMDRIRTKHAACMQERFLSKDQYADHYTVIRSGDYYMFKDVEEDDLEMNEGDNVSEEEESNNKENDDWRRKRTTVAPGTLLATALFGGPKEALSLIEKTSNFSRSISMSSAREFTTPEDEAHSPSSLLDGTASTALGSDSDDARTTVADRSNLSSTSFQSSPHSAIHIFPPPPPPIPIQETCHSAPTTYAKLTRYGDVMPSLPEVTLEMENDVSPGIPTTDEAEKQEAEKEGTDEDETTKKVETSLRMLKAVLIGFIDTLIIRINNSTRHCRSVSQKLHEEKEREKILLRDSVMREYREEIEEGDQKDGCLNHKEDEINNRKRKENEFHNTMPRVIVLIIAISEALAARTDLLCYFAMIINTLMSASILSIVYPLSVFFWGMLSVPRPTKFYWVTTITYTEFIIVLKYLFQFNFFPWNKGVPGKFTWPQIIGIEKKEMYAALDFFVLFCLFIHRMMLKKRGLWTQGQSDEKKVIDVKPSFTDENVNLNPMVSDSNAVSLAGGDGASKNTDDEKNLTLCHKLLNPIKFFYINITNPKYSAVNDVFAYMFACDLLTFLIVVFGYNKFGPSEQMEDSDVTTVIQQSRVPVPFLAMLLVQFVLIIIDRALYLRKLIFGKFIFHIILVIIVHVWMFFLLPIVITDIPFVQNRAAQLWYFTKCIYFSFSCYQVRSGYPIRIVGNFLTKKFGYFNLFCYKGFLAIPFLLELRALTDWMWTDTTLALTSWLQMEEIYANVFVLKCWRKIEHDSPTPRAVPRHPVVKYGLGGLILFLLIFIIWLPLLLFSMSNSIYEPNPPKAAQFKLSIGGYNTSSQPIFSIISQHNQLHPIDTQTFLTLKDSYLTKPKAMAFLNAHREEDVYRIMIGATSASTWEISYPTEQKLINELKGMRNMSFTVEISITREETQSSGMVTNVAPVVFVRNLNSSNDEDKKVLLTLSKMINGSYDESVVVPRLFPRYLTVPSRRKINETGVLEYEWRSIKLSLHQKRDDRSRWWEMKENCSDPPKDDSLDGLVCGSGDGSMIVVFSERVPTGVFTLVNNYGVIGLYVSVILVIGRFVRMQSVGNIQTIMFNNLPYVERLYLLCMDIYLVRQAREFAFEELLFAKLNFLYRSTETMIAWTRHPKPKSE